jgi:tripartite-type tricarboxylate transporter receptor subunit TctC
MIRKSSSMPCLAAGATLAAVFATGPAQAWEPTKPVEIVVAAGAGGASDQMARMMQAAIQKNKLMKQPMIVSLKGGASGAEALIYMKSSAGDPNKMLLAYSLIYMLPLSAKIPFNWRELSPIAVTALDEFVLWDNTTLPQKTTKEFIAAAKAANPPFKMGGTGSKREDQVLTVFMEKKTGAKFLYLPTSRVARPQRNWSAITPSRTSTIPPRTSRSGAPARCARSACSTRSAFPTRARSPATSRGTISQPARRKASTSNI